MNTSPICARAACVALFACLAAATPADVPSGLPRKPRLAFQAYAVRDLCAKDFAGTLKAAKALGYEGVETGRFFGLDAKGLKAACDGAGLELVALQLYPHDLTEPQLANTIRFCRECGCRRINVAWYKGSEENPNDWQLLVNVVNHAAEVCAKAGIDVAYHNHDHEFRMTLAGTRALDWLFDGEGKGLTRQVNETSRFSPLVKQELDPGWCVIAGGDPLAWIKAHPGRNPTVHVMPAIMDADGLRPGEAGVGSARDKADWRRIIPALASDGTEWLVVKPTTFTDSLDDLKASIDYLRTLFKETGGAASGGNVISLAGRWDFALGEPVTCTDTIDLPSTTDIARKGDGRIGGKDVEEISPERDDAAVTSKFTRHLTRRFPYVGKATYERDIDIPSAWAGRRIELFLERTKFVDVMLDGKRIGRCETLAAPATVAFPRGMASGRHRLRLIVDNGLKGRPLSGHQISDDTQTNWNGVMGRMELRSFGTISMPQVKVFPSAAEGKVTAKVVFRNDGAGEARVGVGIDVAGETPATPIKSSFAYVAPCGVSTGEFVVALGPDAPKWSEFNPVLHTLTVRAGEATATVKFGLRDFRTKGTQFTLNGRPVFLRGTHDACVWPLTGAAPMEVEPWRQYFATLKDYGLNHVRFHSWCPPEAAFEAADEAGFYLQPEFAAFGGSFEKDATLRAYCLAESKRIIDAYGNHPSFVMFTLGNECRGGRKERAEIVRALRAHDPRPLYAIATNGDFMNPEQCAEDDFWATFRSCNGAEGNARGSYAHCNAPLGAVQLPGGGTMRDFSSAVRHSTIPLIGHETGQFQAYPDYSEIPKYTGVLKPINLEIFKARLEKVGLGKYAADFCSASGRLMAMNYREEMEEAFRTPGFGGFQLLDIKDFPGQGTALVGILNAFMESKGFIPPEKWRMSCSPTVLLARFPRYTYVSGEKFVADVQIAHYGKEDVLTGDLEWSIEPIGRTGIPPILYKVVTSGKIVIPPVHVGEVKSVGRIEFTLPYLKSKKGQARARWFELCLSFADGKVQNSYPLWVYPECDDVAPDGVEIVRDLESADRALAEGRTALCILDLAKAPTNAVPGFFASDFWNWEMFNGPARKRKVIAPGTLGLLVKREHPALAGFPTSFHSDYQWRELIFNGVNVVLDGDKDVDVIVRGIDNITRNQNLGVIWEKRRGKGRVLYCSLDLEAAKDLPEARALRRSLLDYLAAGL